MIMKWPRLIAAALVLYGIAALVNAGLSDTANRGQWFGIAAFLAGVLVLAAITWIVEAITDTRRNAK